MNLYKKTRENKSYLDYCRRSECCYCGGRAEPHHVRDGVPQEFKGGTGLKPYDLMSIPLCRKCHDLEHRGQLNINPQQELIKHLVRYIEELDEDL